VIDPNASDWSDLDLLTRTEARERLVAEISAAKQDVSREEARELEMGDGAKLAALKRRLAMLQERLES
jgi:hypothetical protein